MADHALSKEAEEVLGIFVEYLNLYHEPSESYPALTRADFDDEQYQLFPQVLMDYTEGSEFRIIRIQADLDDGGGPNILTAFYRHWDDPPEWNLDYIVQYFDTAYNEVYRDGELRGPDGMVKRG